VNIEELEQYIGVEISWGVVDIDNDEGIIDTSGNDTGGNITEGIDGCNVICTDIMAYWALVKWLIVETQQVMPLA